MTWKKQTFGKRRKFESFDQFAFENPKLQTHLQDYVQFIFSRIAFPQGTPCALRKNLKFHPRGDLSPLLLREHAEGGTLMGVTLTHPESGETKAACVTLPNSSVVEAVGQASRILSAFEQEDIPGFLELCPDERVRVWAIFSSPMPSREALRCIHYLKKRAFVSNKGETYPKASDTPLELPPYQEPKTGRWSQVLTLQQAEAFLETGDFPNSPPNWESLCWMGRERRDDESEALLGFLKETYQEGWREAFPEKETEEENLLPAPMDATEPRMCEGDFEKEEIMPTESPVAQSASAYETNLLSALSESVPTVIGRLLDPAATAVPTPGSVLSDVLNGGWASQHLYLLAGPSGEGKTTFCSWAADYAASRQVPVLYVSFQLPKEQMAVYALARNAQIDSAKIEKRIWMNGEDCEESDLTKRIIAAGRHYFHTGDYMHLLEADMVTTAYDIERALVRMRERTGRPENEPVLVIVDSLREMRPVVERSPNDGASSSNLAQVAFELKRLAWSTNSAVIATLDVPSRNLSRLEWNAPATLELDPDYCAAGPNADTSFLIESRCTRFISNPHSGGFLFGEEHRILDPLDHLLEEAGHHPKLARKIQRVRQECPLLPGAASTYCRLVPLKNRGGRTSTQPVFRYDRAYHDFKPIELDNAAALNESREYHAMGERK
jgi:hypothetical protein